MIFESVNKNKIKTSFIVILFFILIGLFVYFLTYIFGENSQISFVIATIATSITSIISYYASDKIVIKANHARIATREEYLQLNESLEALCIGAGLPVPKLYVMDSDSPNAFATGRNPKNAVVCVTTGLLKKLDKYEIEGVLAHELSHIKNYDILLSTVATVMVGGVSIIADSIAREYIRGNDDDDSKGNAIIMLIGII
ncbi:MAG: M48 family metalloprotease, partial [Firmicutes bacterium]|nr:M48 family metalloprotease [Bacillota bacterium]